MRLFIEIDMDNFIDLEKILKQDRYIQGFNANPIFLNLAGWSGLELWDKLGFGYTSFVINYQNGYAEYGYLDSDFSFVWQETKKRLNMDNDYLKKIKNKYERIFTGHKKVFHKIDHLDIKKIDDKKLIGLLKNCVRAQIDSVGLAHIVDTIGIELEHELKIKLASVIKDQKELNGIFAQITSPTQLSFISQEEAELLKIKKLTGKNREKALQSHFKKYFWLQNSYAGPKNLSIEYFSQRVYNLHSSETAGFSPPIGKRGLLSKLKFAVPEYEEIQEIIQLIDFSTIWQDQRKVNILKSIGYLGKILNEMARRLKIPVIWLYQLGINDLKSINEFGDIDEGLQNRLKERIKGVLFILENKNEHVFEGDDYKKILLKRNQLSDTSKITGKDLHGSIANPGTVIGKAVICIGIESLNKVKDGDIIVASMTRPEFMPALKKAAGIVTDEGGITCHAAILARELGIPAIIGTKIATKVLKDGDLIEVKANHGLVRKIN